MKKRSRRIMQTNPTPWEFGSTICCSKLMLRTNRYEWTPDRYPLCTAVEYCCSCFLLSCYGRTLRDTAVTLENRTSTCLVLLYLAPSEKSDSFPVRNFCKWFQQSMAFSVNLKPIIGSDLLTSPLLHTMTDAGQMDSQMTLFPVRCILARHFITVD